jgi:hypothetical protein
MHNTEGTPHSVVAMDMTLTFLYITNDFNQGDTTYNKLYANFVNLVQPTSVTSVKASATKQ